MLNSLHSSVVFNALKEHPELEVIGNELIKRIKSIIKNPQVSLTLSNGINRLNFFGLVELTQDANRSGFIATPDSIQIENLKCGTTPTQLPVWGGSYIESSVPAKTKLPLIGFSGFFLPISIVHALKYGEHNLVKNYLLNAVLLQLIQEKPELFYAPIRSLHWVSSYIHYVEQIFRLENTSMDGLPFIPFDTDEIYGLCEIIEKSYVENFLDSDLVQLFCFYNFHTYKQGDIHKQYVLFANSFGFAKEQLVKQYKKDPFAYALSVLYSDFNSNATPLAFEKSPLEIVSEAFYKQSVQQSIATKRLIVRNLSTLLDKAKANQGMKVVHDLYLHTINSYPYIALTDKQLENHFEFFERAEQIEKLSVEQFVKIMLGLDKALAENPENRSIQIIINTAELVKIWLISKEEMLRKNANIDQIKLISKIKNKIDFDDFDKDDFSNLIDLFIGLKNNADVEIVDHDVPKTIHGLETFEFYNNELSLVLISQEHEIRSTLSIFKDDEKLHDDVLNNNRVLIKVKFGSEESILVVDPHMVGFKFVFDKLVSTDEKPVSELTHIAVNIALQQINFGS